MSILRVSKTRPSHKKTNNAQIKLRLSNCFGNILFDTAKGLMNVIVHIYEQSLKMFK